MTETPVDRAADAAPEPVASAADAAEEGRYAGLSREQLVRLLKRRDAERQLGLVWERSEDGLDVELARNEDFVALSLDAALSHGTAPWQNLIIEGDNFDALRYLRMTHAGRIRCIYIDPPYNTGNRDFVYNDRFVDRSHRFRHSLWLDFMYPRLQLARDLLAEDGVIFVSIDDNELFRLGMLMDRVFGEENKIGVLAWKNVTDNNPSRVVTEHEYVLVYAHSKASCKSVWKSTDVAKKDAMLAVEKELLEKHSDDGDLQAAYGLWFKLNKDQLAPLDNYKFIDRQGIYAGSRSVHNPGKEGYRYDVVHPVTRKPCQQPLMGYREPLNYTTGAVLPDLQGNLSRHSPFGTSARLALDATFQLFCRGSGVFPRSADALRLPPPIGGAPSSS